MNIKRPRHFLELKSIEPTELRRIVNLGVSFKNRETLHETMASLDGRVLAMIFEKPSTRTRVSFEVAMNQLGGTVIVLSSEDMQIGRGETIGDTARVLSRYVDAIMLRTTNEKKLIELADQSEVPVINGLTNNSHPCQLIADIMTFEEYRGDITGKRIAWCGDGNNMARTWIEAAVAFNFELWLACPEELMPFTDCLDWAKSQGAEVFHTDVPEVAVEGADCVVTDTWFSMGDEHLDRRRELLYSYRVDDNLIKKANKDAIFMHCLPAHRGEEVSSEVLDGPKSAVWDEAENRLHAQKGILAWCLA